MIPANDNDVLDVRGAMQLLHIGRDALYAACARQAIPHQRIGRAIRFSRSALMRWLEACGPQVAQKGQ